MPVHGEQLHIVYHCLSSLPLSSLRTQAKMKKETARLRRRVLFPQHNVFPMATYVNNKDAVCGLCACFVLGVSGVCSVCCVLRTRSPRDPSVKVIWVRIMCTARGICSVRVNCPVRVVCTVQVRSTVPGICTAGAIRRPS